MAIFLLVEPRCIYVHTVQQICTCIRIRKIIEYHTFLYYILTLLRRESVEAKGGLSQC